ncbi:phospholipase A1 [Rhizoctonia solani]|uniref:Phospholipase A1 n=1 Tax=Rhizoctonia solani TaxID=456999 RepID=A0A8H7IKT1_9AGAM|nr:phospholipase A1 [Rhizoctonia solani]
MLLTRFNFMPPCHGPYINPGGCESSISGSKVLQQFTSPAGQNGYIEPSKWQTNADSTPTPVSWPGCTGCTVHHGFYTNYLDAKNYTNGFATAFNAASALGYKVNCVGHSLGAAVAAMCAGDLYPSGKVTEIYTYGEFRTMNQAAATWVDSRLGSKVYRVVNGGDSVPAQVLDATYVHHGVGYKRDGSNARTLVCASDTDPECAGGSNVLDHGRYTLTITYFHRY